MASTVVALVMMFGVGQAGVSAVVYFHTETACETARQAVQKALPNRLAAAICISGAVAAR